MNEKSQTIWSTYVRVGIAGHIFICMFIYRCSRLKSKCMHMYVYTCIHVDIYTYTHRYTYIHCIHKCIYLHKTTCESVISTKFANATTYISVTIASGNEVIVTYCLFGKMPLLEIMLNHFQLEISMIWMKMVKNSIKETALHNVARKISAFGLI